MSFGRKLLRESLIRRATHLLLPLSSLTPGPMRSVLSARSGELSRLVAGERRNFVADGLDTFCGATSTGDACRRGDRGSRQDDGYSGYPWERTYVVTDPLVNSRRLDRAIRVAACSLQLW